MENLMNLTVQLNGVNGIMPDTRMNLDSGIVVLTGRNNTGKSRVLRSIAAIGLHFNENFSKLPGIKFSSNIEGKDYILEINQDINPLVLLHDGLKNTEASLDHENYGMHSFISFDKTQGKSNMGSLDNFIANARPTLEFYKFYNKLKDIVYIEPQRVVKSIVQTIPKKVPSPNGSDLAQVIYTHLNENTREYRDLTNLMESMFNEIGGIFTVPSENNIVTLSIWDNFANKNIPLDECGTGIAQVLHLASMILFSEPGKIFLIDEPHVYLHPGAEKSLAQFISSHNEHRYVIATHSPLFIQAVKPGAVYLVSRDNKGTRVRENLSGLESKRLLFDELGINLGDISIAERIIFVEGKTDVDIIGEILERNGFPKSNNNYVIFSLGESDISKQLKDLLVQLESIVHLPYMIYLDGDKKNSGHVPKNIKDRVIFCPELDIEGVLLRDPEAILVGLNKIISAIGLKLISPIEENFVVSTITELKRRFPDQKGAKIITDLFYQLSKREGLAGLKYSKNFGKEIARYIKAEKIKDVIEPFSKFFNETETGS
jgi:predicted ATPase